MSACELCVWRHHGSIGRGKEEPFNATSQFALPVGNRFGNVRHSVPVVYPPLARLDFPVAASVVRNLGTAKSMKARTLGAMMRRCA